MEKVNLHTSISKDISDKLSSIMEMDNFLQSKCAAVEKAIDFYYGFLSSENSQEYLLTAYGQTMQGLLNTLESRLARMIYKSAVETNVLTRVVASAIEVDKEQYDTMRKTAMTDTKYSNGLINLKEV